MDLNDYLKLNSNAIVDLINRTAEITEEPTFDGVAAILNAKKTHEPIFEDLTGLLMGRFVHEHKHGSEVTVGERDKAHNVLAMAMICSLWCGWLSQAKAKNGRYLTEWPDNFKKLIVDAFEIGQRYANDKP